MTGLRIRMRMLAAVAAGFLLVGTMSVADAVHVPNCFGQHPTNTPTSGDDTINGTTGPDVLAGGDGNDTIRGFEGDDRLCGNGGDDRIFGEAGFDRISGDAGADVLGGGSTVITGLCDPSTSDGFSVSDVGNLVNGGSGNDQLTGANVRDTLNGQGGRDCIRGLQGIDFLNGGGGNDGLHGGPHNDVLSGSTGNDRQFDTSPASSTFDDFDQLFGTPGTTASMPATAMTSTALTAGRTSSKTPAPLTRETR